MQEICNFMSCNKQTNKIKCGIATLRDEMVKFLINEGEIFSGADVKYETYDSVRERYMKVVGHDKNDKE